VTRIRMPRTHGLPPHCLGFTVGACRWRWWARRRRRRSRGCARRWRRTQVICGPRSGSCVRLAAAPLRTGDLAQPVARR
jgi:hypothetical protein